MDEIIRYTDLQTAVKLALEEGMSKQKIVRVLTGSATYADARKTATFAAPLLDLTVAEFLKLRKND
jgi:hypothetical protein